MKKVIISPNVNENSLEKKKKIANKIYDAFDSCFNPIHQNLKRKNKVFFLMFASQNFSESLLKKIQSKIK